MSYIGFKTKSITITNKAYNANNKNYFKIVLEKETYTLQEVEIQNDKTDESVFKSSSNNAILDYELYGENIIVLLKNGNRRKIRVINRHTWDWFYIDLTIKATELYEDCINNTHLITKDSIYQFKLNVQDATIYFYHSYPLTKFQKTLHKCVGFLNNKYIFKTYTAHNQKIKYWFVKDKQKKVLYTVFDKERYLFAQNFLDRIRKLRNKYGIINDMGDITVNQLKIARKIKQLNFGYRLIGKIPTYNPLFVNKDTIIIFDHMVDSICFFNKTLLLFKKEPVKYPKSDLWKIFFDPITNSFYVTYLHSGVLSVYVLDVSDGSIKSRVARIECLFPEKVKIYDNVIYYLENDKLHNRKVLKRHNIKKFNK